MINLNSLIMVNYFHYIFYCILFFYIIILIKIKFFKEIKKICIDNKIIYGFVFLIFIIIAFFIFPFEYLVGYDEQNYLLTAKNIIENNKNGFCFNKINNNCISYSSGPHGNGLSVIYSLFYSKNLDLFYKKIAIFILFISLINSIIVYLISYKLFNNKIISISTSILFLFNPLNIMYSTNIMPETIATFLLLISTFCLLYIFDKGNNNNYIHAYFMSLCLLSFLRVEYILLLIISLIFLIIFLILNKIKIKTFNNYLFNIVTFITIVISFLYSIHYSLNKGDIIIKLEFLNISYLSYYLSNIFFLLLSVFFIFSIFYITHLFYKKNQRKKMFIFIYLFFIFSIYIFLYSLYYHQNVFRYLRPTSFIFFILAITGFYYLLKDILNFDKVIIKKIFFIFIIIGIIIFTNSAFIFKKNEIKKQEELFYFLELIDKNGLESITNNKSLNNYYIFATSYLGDMVHIENYLDHRAFNNFEINDKNIYFLDNLFIKIDETFFYNNSNYSIKLIYQDKKFPMYKIYEIKNN